MTHEPNQLLDWYWNHSSGKNMAHLIRDHLRGRCKLRMAGDLHHYMRHSYIPSDKPVHVHHLLVNGCGGAFLHPNHVFSNFRGFNGTPYEMKAAYPSYEDSSKCQLNHILRDDSFSGHVKNFFATVLDAFFYMLEYAYVSLAGYHTLYEWYRQMEQEHFPDPTGL